MARGRLIGFALASVLLLAATTVQAGWPLGRLGNGRLVQPDPPAPRIIDVAPYAGSPPAVPPYVNSPYWGHAAAPRAYPWGHFGARSRPGFVLHSGYYGDVSHWWQ